jgi:glycosyltransferase involved in cell wall biosynthesis
MKLLIGIATYRRIEKLKRCLDSIFSSTYTNYQVVVVSDNNDFETAEFLKNSDYPNLKVDVQPSRQFVIGAWNKVVKENVYHDFDGFIGLCDDVELLPSTLEMAFLSHATLFSDTDGVVGFNQKCPGRDDYTFKWYGQTLIGRKFIERYSKANYQICCPDYKHFYQDEEMFYYAHSLGKFAPCKEALLYHYHPSFLPNEKDETHDIVRLGICSPKKYDFDVYTQRRKLGYLWGSDFNLIGDKNGRTLANI